MNLMLSLAAQQFILLYKARAVAKEQIIWNFVQVSNIKRIPLKRVLHHQKPNVRPCFFASSAVGVLLTAGFSLLISQILWKWQ